MRPTQRLAMQATRALRSAHPDFKNGVYVQYQSISYHNEGNGRTNVCSTTALSEAGVI